ncbi:unnamed protein product, partial [Chrysoparadoxa australica]
GGAVSSDFSGGKGGGLSVDVQSSVVVNLSTWEGNKATTAGSAFSLSRGSDLVMSDCALQDTRESVLKNGPPQLGALKAGNVADNGSIIRTMVAISSSSMTATGQIHHSPSA